MAALSQFLFLNHTLTSLVTVALIALICSRMAAFSAIVGLFLGIISVQMRGSLPVLVVDEHGRQRLALTWGAPIAGLVPGMFLVATEHISSGLFCRSVVLLLDFGPLGARGVIVSGAATGDTPPRRLGGPVPESVLVHTVPGLPGASWLALSDDGDVFIGGDRAGLGLSGQAAVFEGIARWAPGQLDGELRRGLWACHGAGLAQVMGDGQHLWASLRASRTLRTVGRRMEPTDA